MVEIVSTMRLIFIIIDYWSRYTSTFVVQASCPLVSERMSAGEMRTKLVWPDHRTLNKTTL